VQGKPQQGALLSARHQLCQLLPRVACNMIDLAGIAAGARAPPCTALPHLSPPPLEPSPARQLKQLSGISTPDASTILISPFDKTSIKAIEKAINESDVSGAQACLAAV
jgi:hypothetical protein